MLVAIAPFVHLACAGTNAGPSAAETGAPPPTPPPATGCAPGAPCPPPPSCEPGHPCSAVQGTAGPLGRVYTTDPSALASILAAAAAAGSAILSPPSATEDPAELGLRESAAKYAAGMQPEGNIARASLSEDGHVGFMTELDPSKCYTIVAYGAGVSDIDINLLAPPLYNFLAGQDGLTGPTAVIGAAPNLLCPIVPLSIPYKVDLHAKKGGGVVAARVYAKPR